MLSAAALDRSDSLTRRKPARKTDLQLCGGEEIESGHAERAGRILECSDRADRHHFAEVVSGFQIRKIAGGQAEAVVRLGIHLICASQEIEVVDVGRSHVDGHRLEHAGDRNAQQFGLRAVDVGIDLRRAGIEQRERLGEARIAATAPTTSQVAFSSAGRPRPAAILDVSLEAATCTNPWHRRRLEHEDERIGQDRELLAHIGQDLGGSEIFLDALLERLENDEDHAGVGGVGECRSVKADERIDVLDALALENDVGRLAQHLVGTVKRCAGRKLEGRDQIATIKLRDEAGRCPAQQIEGQIDQAAIDDEQDDAHFDQPPRQAAIAGAEPDRTPN